MSLCHSPRRLAGALSLGAYRGVSKIISNKVHSASASAIERARRLRGDMTVSELRLWTRLRGEQIDGYRFRRQVPIGPYIVDFACPRLKLIVEVDGGQHAVGAERDGERTSWLESRGYRVLRFWNNDVLDELEGVVETIRSEIPSGSRTGRVVDAANRIGTVKDPLPNPPRKGGGRATGSSQPAPQKGAAIRG